MARPTHYRSPSGEIKEYNPGSEYEAKFGGPRPAIEGGGGGAGADSQAVREFIEGSSTTGFLQGREAMENELLNQLTGQMQAQPSLESLYTQFSTEAGIPALQQQVSGFRGSLARTQELLEQLEPNITERITPFEVTEGQRARMLASEQAPLTRQIGTLSRALGVSSEDLGMALGNVQQRLGFAASEQQRELEPLKLRLQTMSEQSARAVTGFTSDRQTQLDFLMDELKRGRELSDRDWKQAQQLAEDERTYKRERKDTLDDMYREEGLQPGTTQLSPLGQYLEEQETLAHQRDLEARRASKAGGGTAPASQREYEYLLSQGFTPDQAAEAAFGLEKEEPEDPFDAYINEQLENQISGRRAIDKGYTGPAGRPSFGDILSNIF